MPGVCSGIFSCDQPDRGIQLQSPFREIREQNGFKCCKHLAQCGLWLILQQSAHRPYAGEFPHRLG